MEYRDLSFIDLSAGSKKSRQDRSQDRDSAMPVGVVQKIVRIGKEKKQKHNKERKKKRRRRETVAAETHDDQARKDQDQLRSGGQDEKKQFGKRPEVDKVVKKAEDKKRQ